MKGEDRDLRGGQAVLVQHHRQVRLVVFTNPPPS